MPTVIALACIGTGLTAATLIHRAYGYAGLLLLAISGVLFLSHVVPD